MFYLCDVTQCSPYEGLNVIISYFNVWSCFKNSSLCESIITERYLIRSPSLHAQPRPIYLVVKVWYYYVGWLECSGHKLVGLPSPLLLHRLSSLLHCLVPRSVHCYTRTHYLGSLVGRCLLLHWSCCDLTIYSG